MPPEATPVEQLREAVEHGTVVFTPPWLADVLLEIVGRLEALETLAIAEQEERVAFSEGRSAYERLVSPPPQPDGPDVDVMGHKT